MQSDAGDATSGHDQLHHHGTISADGIVSFDGSGGEIAGFGAFYPFPTFSLAPDTSALDAFVPPPAGQAITDAADAGGTTSGSGGTSLETQGQGNPASGLVIVANYDSSITNLPTAQYDDVTQAITAAIDFYEAKITNPTTLTIDFSVGDLGARVLSDSTPLGGDISYSTLLDALENHDTAAGASSLPASNPFGTSDWFVSYSELKALGFSPGNAVDGDVELNDNGSVSFFYSGPPASGEYDAIGALEHEISEVMGRVAYYGDEGPSPLDLFRYSSPGTLATTGAAAYFSINNGTTDLDAFNNNTANGGDAGDWNTGTTIVGGTTVLPVLDDSYDAFASRGVANTVSSTDLTVMEMLGYSLAPACYAAGTRILTARGEVRVEDLAVGDMVRARFAGLAPIKWIGHRRIDCRRHPDPQQVWPVRIVAGAFGPDQPCRDVFLSPDHAVAVDGALIPIRLLVNGASIRQEIGMPQVHYFHIELDRHDLLIADGLAAESYLDTGNRGMFANADLPIVLHPTLEAPAAQQRREARSCLKLRGDPAHVEPVWRALAARAEHLGLALPAVATTHDPALCIVAGARRFAPVLHDGGRYTFALPALPGGARLRSRCVVPSAVRPWLEDRRRLGVMVRRIALRCGTDVVDVAPDDPRLSDGWWAAEGDDASVWRWTNGDAALPPTDDFALLEVLIGETPPYPLAAPAGARWMSGVHLAAQAAGAASAVCTRSAA